MKALQINFARRAQALFASRPGFARKWKKACAEALNISRATLYRYIEQENAVPDDVWECLANLEGKSSHKVRDDREMISLYAAALVRVQDVVDKSGWLRPPYPDALQRVFSLGAARNLTETERRWPTDLPTLLNAATSPLSLWVPDMNWDTEALYFETTLLSGGELTPECRALAAKGQDPELELEENEGYRLLRGICADRTDSDEVYRAWRRLIIEHPLLPARRSHLLNEPALASVDRWPDLLEGFYAPLPEAATVRGQVPLCTVSGTVLRSDERGGFFTECRLPDAVRRARQGEHKTQTFTPGMSYLRRAFRTYWCLPGLTELDLANRITRAGWKCTLWPRLDTVDLVAKSPDGHRQIAADVKDYLSPGNLARRFDGFKQYASTHECFLIVPDYVAEAEPRFSDRFESVRSAAGRAPVRLRTVSGLMSELRELF